MSSVMAEVLGKLCDVLQDTHDLITHRMGIMDQFLKETSLDFLGAMPL